LEATNAFPYRRKQNHKNKGVEDMTVTLTVNGKRQTSPAAPDTPLLYVLRNDLELNSCKFGCGQALCGACTVIHEGNAIRSCVTPVGSVGSGAITTLEGIGSNDKLHALQKAFIEEQAAQCGFCSSGMIMSAKVLLDSNRAPTEADIRNALAGNLCRCGAHSRIIKAVQRAAREMHA
jgi:nicotinate dehydrogenase subunit A